MPVCSHQFVHIYVDSNIIFTSNLLALIHWRYDRVRGEEPQPWVHVWP